MTVYTIYLKTDCQHNTYVVDDKSKIMPYIDDCMKEIKNNDNKYVITWFSVDFAVIYVADKDGKEVFPTKSFGKITRDTVH